MTLHLLINISKHHADVSVSLRNKVKMEWSCSVTSDSLWPHGPYPTRLLRPWDSPDKNTGVGCHFLFQCMKVKSESKVSRSCPTHSDPMDCSLPGSSVHGIFQARVLEWAQTLYHLSHQGSPLRNRILTYVQ